ncbi:hypothetical protein [Methylomonas sp. AM2-LC]|uniref:hypothetical protein n=1 Tax=Methylomonas sp. AM2-LC TaxID=3153301 RepID=UPI003267D910
MQDKKQQGIFNKFIVYRVDNKSDFGEKHYGCDYFVLDLTHDPLAFHAIRAYVK